MARNDDRRHRLADAGLRVLAEKGARGLTHRAVDTAAAVPQGTTSNYFRDRDALITGLVTRIGERLGPTESDLAARADQEPGRALFADYLRDIVRRLSEHSEVTLALLELRLESTRRPAVAEALTHWRRLAFEGDIAFHLAAGLPGGPREIALFHYALEGLILDRLTGPLTPEVSTDQIIDDLVAGLMPADEPTDQAKDSL